MTCDRCDFELPDDWPASRCVPCSRQPLAERSGPMTPVKP